MGIEKGYALGVGGWGLGAGVVGGLLTCCEFRQLKLDRKFQVRGKVPANGEVFKRRAEVSLQEGAMTRSLFG